MPALGIFGDVLSPTHVLDITRLNGANRLRAHQLGDHPQESPGLGLASGRRQQHHFSPSLQRNPCRSQATVDLTID
jgi:hypothetical protein